jgi:glutamine synthetase
VIARYAEHGLAPVVATELEFFVFAPNSDPQLPFQPPLGKDGRREMGHSAFSVSSNNGLRPFFSEVYRCMAALGLPRDTFMHEMGVSQFEINLLHGDPLLLADQTLLFKHLLKEVAPWPDRGVHGQAAGAYARQFDAHSPEPGGHRQWAQRVQR